MQRMPLSWVGARGGRKENLLNLLGNRPALAVFDRHVINFTDGRHLSRRSREEGFVGIEQVVEPQRPYLHSIAKVARDLHHHLATDTEKHRLAIVIGHSAA